jgi:Domain of unknown function (DUF4149)
LLPGLWAGSLLCVALIAAPAPFATLPSADAGRVVARIFAQEAWLSLGLAALFFLLERALKSRLPGSPALNVDERLILGSVACTVLGYFGVQALLPAARAGQVALSFGQLHLLSVALFALKSALVLVLAWRTGALLQAVNRPSS